MCRTFAANNDDAAKNLHTLQAAAEAQNQGLKMDKCALRSSLKKKLKDWRAYCWLPVVKQRPGRPEDSKFSGIPVLKRGEKWPRCNQCRRLMPLFVQLNFDQLPPASKSDKKTKGIVQLFFCTGNRCDTDDTSKKPAFLARLLAGKELGSLVPAKKNAASVSFPEKVIVGWQRRHDYPCHEAASLPEQDLRAFWSHYDRENGFPRRGDKLLGWHNWIQGEVYPTCPVCHKEMFCNLFQLDSEDNLPFMFGDAGNGCIFMCHDHPKQVTFKWSCY